MLRLILATAVVKGMSAAADAQVITSAPTTFAGTVLRPGQNAVGIEAKGVRAAPAGMTISKIELELGTVVNGSFVSNGYTTTLASPVQAQTATTPYSAKFMAIVTPPTPLTSRTSVPGRMS